MAVSQNGWVANDPTLVSRRTVPGTNVGITVRIGAPGDLLLEVAAQFDRFVQDIDNARRAVEPEMGRSAYPQSSSAPRALSMS